MRSPALAILAVLALVFTVSITREAAAQYGELRLYDSAVPTNCSLVDISPGLRTVFVIHSSAVSGVAGSQFGIQAGAGVTMEYNSFTPASGMIHIGSGPASLSVAYGSCRTGTFQIGTLSYFGLGTSALCSSINVVADPTSPIPGSVVAIDCSFDARAVTGGAIDVNPTLGCAQPCAQSFVPQPAIKSIEDVPNDQGKQVSIEWWRSGRDQAGSPTPVTQYAIYRQIDEDLARTPPGLTRLNRGIGATPPGTWHFLGTVPARGDNVYALVVPTLKDATDTEMYTSVFFVSALTAAPLTYFDSAVQSGFSIDNLEPSIPPGFVVAYNTGHGNELSWGESEDPDVQHYQVYRSTTTGALSLSPSGFELVAATTSTNWVDPDFDGWDVEYRISAVDFAGNESELAPPSQPPTGIGDAPAASLHVISTAPNPFSRSTMISFNVPAGERDVRLTVYDVSGRRVRTLVEGGANAGVGRATWDGRDRNGHLCASGVYFVILASSRGESVRKVVITR